MEIFGAGRAPTVGATRLAQLDDGITAGPVPRTFTTPAAEPTEGPVSQEPWDCLVIGGGPAGLTAALYLGRFRRRVLVIDAGYSRAAMIPTTHNFPAFPRGISGSDLLARLREQALEYGAVIENGHVDALTSMSDGFAASAGTRHIGARRVILTTGVQDNDSGIADVEPATKSGSIRWCPVCDGYEIMDRNVAVLACARNCVSHARFLRTYTRSLSLFVLPQHPRIGSEVRQELAHQGIELVNEPVESVTAAMEGDVIIRLASGRERRFDTVYPMLGQEARTGLALRMGARCSDVGELEVDGHQQTTVPGLYAAGDVVRALNQMAVGMAHAATAATAIHNGLPFNPR